VAGTVQTKIGQLEKAVGE